MRAVRITGPGTVEIAELDRPGQVAGEVLVEVACAAICSTDRKLVARGQLVGRVPGHEVAGRLADGTPVGVHPDTGCGRCAACRRGQTNLCPDKQAVGIDRDGGLAQAVAVPAAHAVPLDGVPLAVAPLLEPLACCVHAVRRAGAFDGPALVVGAGAMGLLLMWVLQAEGHRVAVCQRSPDRRARAAQLGADAVLGPDDDVVASLGEPPAAVFVTAPGAEALTWALERVATAGVVHAFAGSPGGASVDANLVHYRHLTLVGSTGSGLVDYAAAAELVRRGTVDLARLPVRRTDLAGASGAVTVPEPGSALRTVVDLEAP
ncbi:alcohol dehydrogenase catalytic domain-containing protein [Georgenia alba]|uniref:Alcohol dehydrogenase catalytic domain-containing protein n=1 Tax=Georgenia alba TaxID=2233858 RepID=A0ABW2Q3P4_9MICO